MEIDFNNIIICYKSCLHLEYASVLLFYQYSWSVNAIPIKMASSNTVATEKFLTSQLVRASPETPH